MAGFLDDLAERAGAYTPEETAVARACFNALLTGAPAAIPHLLRRLGMSAATGTRVVAALAQEGVLAVDADVVTVARGLSRPATPHQLQVNEGPVVYACCAVDAVGIPAALGAEATIESGCHHCQAPLRLTVKDGAVTGDPPGIVIWAVERDLSRSLRAHT